MRLLNDFNSIYLEPKIGVVLILSGKAWVVLSLILLFALHANLYTSSKNIGAVSFSVTHKQSELQHSVSTLEKPEPVLFNLTINHTAEIDSPLEYPILAKTSSGSVLVAVTSDAVLAIQGESWRYDLLVDGNTYDFVVTAIGGDIDGDGSDEILVLGDSGFLYAISASTGSLVFRISLGISADRIVVADVVGLGGNEILLFSESSDEIYVVSSSGLYMGSLSMNYIDDIEDIVAGEVNASIEGKELCVLGYDTGTGSYYIEVYNLKEFPQRSVFVASYDLSSNYMTGVSPSNIHGKIYFKDITDEAGDEIIITGVRKDTTSSIRLVVLNSSVMLSKYWSLGLSLGSSKKWAYAYFYDYDNDSKLEIIVCSSKVISIVKNSTKYTNTYMPSGIDTWNASIYMNSDTSNISSMIIYYNETSALLLAGIMNPFNGTILKNISLVPMVDPAVRTAIISGTTYYVDAIGRIITGNVSGLTLSNPTTIYVYTYFGLVNPKLPGSEVRPIFYSPGWARVYSPDGTIAEEYKEPLSRSMFIVAYGDYISGSSGYELAISDFEYIYESVPRCYIKIVSGGSVIKEFNVTLPANKVYGIYLAPPYPSSTTTILIMYNMSSYDYRFAKFNLNDGSITIGSKVSDINMDSRFVRIGGKYYYVFWYSSKMYFVDPNMAYIASIKNFNGDIKSVVVGDVDEDGSDEIVVRTYSGFYYYLYLVQDDLSADMISGGYYYISPPIIYDILGYPGVEIVAGVDYYMFIYNPVTEDQMFTYIGGFYFDPIFNIPLMMLDEDLIVPAIRRDNLDLYVIRLYGSANYSDADTELVMDLRHGSYDYYSAAIPQENSGGLACVMFSTSDDRFAVGLIGYDIDNFEPEMTISSPYLINTNITDYIAWNDTLPIIFNISDDKALLSFYATVRYYDRSGSIISTENFYVPLENKTSASVNIILYVPEDTYSISLSASAYDPTGRADTIDYSIIMDWYAPTIWPQVPSRIDITSETALHIAAYVGDDVLLKTVYIQYDGATIPMRTTEEAEPRGGIMYYYEADVQIRAFSGEKTLSIVAVDFVGRTTIYNITIHSTIPVYGTPTFQVGLGITILVLAAVSGYLLYRRRRKAS